MISLLSLLLCTAGVLSHPAPPCSDSPTPTQPLPPPPSVFPSSLPGVPFTSTSVWMPPQPSVQPPHYGPLEATRVWISYPDGMQLYSMCVAAKVHGDHGRGKGRGRGSKVVIENCSDDPNQLWSYGIQSGPPQIKVSGTDLCLDAGRNPRAGSKLSLAPCDNTSSQNFYVTNTGLWVLNDRTNGYLCADITGGSRAEGTPLQLWPCALNNYNQDFYPAFCWDHICYM